MSIEIRPHHERGCADFGWLQSLHSFSFGSYYDAKHMGFSALRVINDDRVAAGAGFETHSHKDMEIISYVLDGEIAHKDSQGNVTQLPAGEFQLMSAGSGIAHSEFNPLQQPLHFLQIWIKPNVLGQKPGYQQKHFGDASGFTLVASPDGAQGSLVIKQDARIFQVLLGPEEINSIETTAQRHYYLHLIEGELSLDGVDLKAGDGAKVALQDQVKIITKNQAVRALWFDLP